MIVTRFELSLTVKPTINLEPLPSFIVGSRTNLSTGLLNILISHHSTYSQSTPYLFENIPTLRFHPWMLWKTQRQFYYKSTLSCTQDLSGTQTDLSPPQVCHHFGHPTSTPGKLVFLLLRKVWRFPSGISEQYYCLDWCKSDETEPW